VDLKLELVLIPVTDVDRARAFYTEKMGFNLDVDISPLENFRVVQVTPPGSACSIGFGEGITDAPPGSTRGLHLVVTDIEAARAELSDRGVEITEVRHLKDGEWTPDVDPTGSSLGTAHTDYNSFADFNDPDGNTWLLQEIHRDA
jgi:catechol 2,3-dioxygenase-like lactoylglutathione lyase family enzyme